MSNLFYAMEWIVFLALLKSISALPQVAPQQRSSFGLALESVNATERPWNASQDLQCACDPGSFYCTPRGFCDARDVAVRLRAELDVWRKNMADRREFPGDIRMIRWNEVACRWLNRQSELKDLFLLDYLEENWRPVCLRHEGKAASCSIAPIVSGSHQQVFSMSAEETRMKLKEMHSFLRCSTDAHPLPNVTSSLFFCSSKDACNAEELNISTPAWQIILIVALPCIALLLIIIALLLVYRNTIWARVYTVRENKTIPVIAVDSTPKEAPVEDDL